MNEIEILSSVFLFIFSEIKLAMSNDVDGKTLLDSHCG